MNIFYLHNNPQKAATYMYNKHVVKMILESAQLLCTAHIMLDGDNANVPYKMTHKNHPSAIWTRESLPNYFWVYEHMIALGKEYTKRYGKQHLTIAKCRDILSNPPKNLSKSDPTEIPQCMPEEFKHANPVIGYWNYYIKAKNNIVNSNEIAYNKIPNEIYE